MGWDDRMNWQMIGTINPETVVDLETPSPLQSYLQRECLQKAYEELGKLPHREVRIVMLRNYEGRTLDDVRHSVVNPRTGKPVSRERIRQLGDHALGKVRTALVEGGYGLE
jgi:DNA-directed RNA polymerase sigma subunit (sigma70/sigma32)